MSEITILAETSEGHLAPVTWELLNLGRRLANESGLLLSACLIGAGVKGASQEVIERGADKVYLVEEALLARPDLALYARALERAIAKSQPTLLLMGHTLLGKELAPFLAARLNSGVVTNCVNIKVDQGGTNVEAECPVYGGSVSSVYKFDSSMPRIATIQLRLVDPAPRKSGKRGEVISIDAELKGVPQKAKVISKQTITGPRLEDAAIIVSGGKGLKKKENYKYIEELAETLGGLPGASRAITDEKWADASRWIGLTGKTVAPDLYIAVGISGAPQHMAGCSKSRAIVAINNDKDAGIFRYARYGVEADCLEFLPAFIQKCKATKTAQR